jgi:hypothetical protein
MEKTYKELLTELLLKINEIYNDPNYQPTKRSFIINNKVLLNKINSLRTYLYGYRKNLTKEGLKHFGVKLIKID